MPARWTFRGSRGSETIVAISDIDIRESLPERIFTSTVLQYGDAALDARTRRREVERSQ